MNEARISDGGQDTYFIFLWGLFLSSYSPGYGGVYHMNDRTESDTDTVIKY